MQQTLSISDLTYWPTCSIVQKTDPQEGISSEFLIIGSRRRPAYGLLMILILLI